MSMISFNGYVLAKDAETVPNVNGVNNLANKAANGNQYVRLSFMVFDGSGIREKTRTLWADQKSGFLFPEKVYREALANGDIKPRLVKKQTLPYEIGEGKDKKTVDVASMIVTDLEDELDVFSTAGFTVIEKDEDGNVKILKQGKVRKDVDQSKIVNGATTPPVVTTP